MKVKTAMKKTHQKNAQLFFLIAIIVILSAFGAHGLKNTLSEKHLNAFEVSMDYLKWTSVILLVINNTTLAGLENLKNPIRLLLLGLGLFSGTLILYALSGIKFFAMITPLGGVMMVISYLWMAFALSKQSKDEVSRG